MDLNVSPSLIIAMVAVVISALSLLFSVRLGRRSAHITTYRSATDLALEMDKIFVSHPRLRPFFYDGEDVSGQPEDTRHQVAAVAEFMLDCLECIWDLRDTYEPDDRRSWQRFVVDMLDASPPLGAMYRQRRGQDWYPALDNLMADEAEGRRERTQNMQKPPPSGSPDNGRVLIRLEEAPTPLVRTFYDALLTPQFPEDELESFEQLARSLGDGAGGILAVEAGRVVGGVVDEAFDEAGVQLISYLAVDPSARGHGLGAQLVRGSVAASPFPLIVGEIEDPRYWAKTGTTDPVARVRFWARLGCRVLPLPYVQPRLDPQGDRVRHLLLIVLAGSGTTPEVSVQGAPVAAFLREYFTATEGAEPEDQEYRDLIERCSPDSLRLWPLDQLDVAVPTT